MLCGALLIADGALPAARKSAKGEQRSYKEDLLHAVISLTDFNLRAQLGQIEPLEDSGVAVLDASCSHLVYGDCPPPDEGTESPRG